MTHFPRLSFFHSLVCNIKCVRSIVSSINIKSPPISTLWCLKRIHMLLVYKQNKANGMPSSLSNARCRSNSFDLCSLHKTFKLNITTGPDHGSHRHGRRNRETRTDGNFWFRWKNSRRSQSSSEENAFNLSVGHKSVDFECAKQSTRVFVRSHKHDIGYRCFRKVALPLIQLDFSHSFGFRPTFQRCICGIRSDKSHGLPIVRNIVGLEYENGEKST